MTEDAQPSSSDDKYREQVLERFRAHHKSFVQQFTVFAIFCLSFLAFILVPIVALRFEASRLEAELQGKEAAIAAQRVQLDVLKAEQTDFSEQQAAVEKQLAALGNQQRQMTADAEAARVDLATLTDRLADIDRQKSEVGKSLAVLRENTSRVTEVLASFDAGTRTTDLRNWFQQMADASYSAPDPACTIDPSDSSVYFGCMVRNKLHADWDSDMQHIEETIVLPLSKIEPETADAIGQAIAGVRATFEAELENHPDFWHTVNEKQEFMILLEEKLGQSFADIDLTIKEKIAVVEQEEAGLQKEIDALSIERQGVAEEQARIAAARTEIEAGLKTLAGQAAELGKKKAAVDQQVEMTAASVATLQGEITTATEALNERRSVISRMQAAIEQRLADFQSPFGKLPLGLKEAALAFPFIIAAGFLICALLQATLLRLRQEYHSLFEKGTTLNARQVRHRVALLAPLWLDPVKARWLNATVAAVLLLPVLAFVATVWLSANGMLLPVEGEPSDRYLTLFYYVLYAIGLVLVGTGIWRVMMAWNAYLGDKLVKPA
jgi:multidrug efflux pump subunit AcrA (membrane-fusion protein)